MNKHKSMDKILDILEQSALKFRNEFNPNLEYYFLQEESEDEIIVHFNIVYGRRLEYLIIFRKLNVTVNYIPNLKGYNKLDTTVNPYRKLKFTDENAILGNIYDLIKIINTEEIACYQKFGIILRNPLELIGIYNINIKFTTEKEWRAKW